MKLSNKQKYVGIPISVIMIPVMAVGFIGKFIYTYLKSGIDIFDVAYEEFDDWIRK